MPLSAQHKAGTHRQIVDAAAGLLRRHGPSGTGVARVMKHAGLTHGGFYAHFASKDELLAAAFEAAVIDSGDKLADGLEGLPAAEKRRHYIGRYLSRAHRDNPGDGCPLAALGSDLARAEPAARQGFERGMQRLMAGFEKVLPGAPKSPAANTSGEHEDEKLLGLMAMMVGGIMLSRAVAEEEFSDHILRSVRRAALKAVEDGGPGDGQ